MESRTQSILDTIGGSDMRAEVYLRLRFGHRLSPPEDETPREREPEPEEEE